MQIHGPTIDLLEVIYYLFTTYLHETDIKSSQYNIIILVSFGMSYSLISFEKTVSLPNKGAPLSCDASFSSWVDQYVTVSFDN